MSIKKMELVLSADRTIKGIQDEFNTRFPYLKLEFFSKPHTKGGGSSKKLMKSGTKTLKECSNMLSKGHISILPTHTVAELEETFRDRFGLHVQVFRKSGKIWLETTATDGWSLQKQNEQGEAISNFSAAPDKEAAE